MRLTLSLFFFNLIVLVTFVHKDDLISMCIWRFMDTVLLRKYPPDSQKKSKQKKAAGGLSPT